MFKKKNVPGGFTDEMRQLATEHLPDGVWKTQIFEGRLRKSNLSPLETDKQPGICGIHRLVILQIFASALVYARPCVI